MWTSVDNFSPLHVENIPQPKRMLITVPFSNAFQTQLHTFIRCDFFSIYKAFFSYPLIHSPYYGDY